MRLPATRAIRSRLARLSATVEARDFTRREVEAIEIMHEWTDTELAEQIAALEREAGDPAPDVRELERLIGHLSNQQMLAHLAEDDPKTYRELRRRRDARRAAGMPSGPGCSATPPPGGIRPLTHGHEQMADGSKQTPRPPAGD